jgi:hypothetical protein
MAGARALESWQFLACSTIPSPISHFLAGKSPATGTGWNAHDVGYRMQEQHMRASRRDATCQILTLTEWTALHYVRYFGTAALPAANSNGLYATP